MAALPFQANPANEKGSEVLKSKNCPPLKLMGGERLFFKQNIQSLSPRQKISMVSSLLLSSREKSIASI